MAIGVAIISVIRAAKADAPPSTQPGATQTDATQPDSPEPPPYKITIPPGFHNVNASGFNVLISTPDDGWARDAVAAVRPATAPSTMPSDVLATLTAKHDALIAEMTHDLCMTDPAPAKQFLDNDIAPLLEKATHLHPPIYFMVASEPQIVRLIRGGWSDPRFYYNRTDNRLLFERGVPLTVEHQGDDQIVPVVVLDGASQADQAAALMRQITQTQGEIEAALAMQTPGLLLQKFAEFVETQFVKAFTLPTDQQWLNQGLKRCLACQYTSELTGIDRDEIIQRTSADNPDVNPLMAGSVDALHPIDPADLKPQYAALYLDALARKATLAVNKALAHGGADSAAKIVASLKQSVPADNQALLKRIADITGVDLTADLSAGYGE